MDGMADAVVTEDSDVLVYSAACMQSFPIIYKLDRNTGDCDVISMDWLLQRCPSSASLDYGGTFSLRRLLHSQLPSTTKMPPVIMARSLQVVPCSLILMP